MVNSTNILQTMADQFSSREIPIIGPIIDTIASFIQPVVQSINETPIGSLILVGIIIVSFIFAFRKMGAVVGWIILGLLILAVLRALTI